jgi:SPP1 gp7 family putative phage head morphogenesis protein
VKFHFHLGATPHSNIQGRMGEQLARHLAGADLLGRLQVVKRVRRKSGVIVPITRVSDSGQPHFRQFAEDDSTDINDLVASFSTDLAQDDEAEYIQSLVPVIREVFDGLSTQYRKDAFTLAATADVRLIEKIRDALAGVASKGGTSEDFQAAVNAITDDAGVAQLDAFTLDTAFNTAMQKAYSRGRYLQMSDPAVKAVLPYWQYWTVGDDRVRPEHRVLNRFVARADDPVWLKIYPPNGFNCRCSVIALTREEALAADKHCDEPGYSRLPLLAQLKVPQAGFGKVFGEAA